MLPRVLVPGPAPTPAVLNRAPVLAPSPAAVLAQLLGFTNAPILALAAPMFAVVHALSLVPMLAVLLAMSIALNLAPMLALSPAATLAQLLVLNSAPIFALAAPMLALCLAATARTG